MKQILILAILAAVSLVGFSATRHASAATCQLWANKPYRHCIRYNPPPATTTTTTTTTLPPTTTTTDPPVTDQCVIGSDIRLVAYNDALTYYAYSSNADTIQYEAMFFVAYCGTDATLAVASQAVLDCFASAPWYFGQCAQQPTDPVGLWAAVLVPVVEPGGITAEQDAACRENGPGRVHAINDVYAYETTWAQPEADAVVADALKFITFCATYPRSDDLRLSSQVLADCLNGWVGLLPHFQACYLPGNEINYYLHDLLTSSG